MITSMKNIILAGGLAISLLSPPAGIAQNTVRMSAVKANNYGVAYTLPKTAIRVYVTVKKSVQNPGEFHSYAERFLGIQDAIKQSSTTYSIEHIESATIGIPDSDNSFLVEFRSNTQAPFVTLSPEGLIYAINSNGEEMPSIQAPDLPTNKTEELPSPRSFLTEEILSTGTTAKEAEMVARQIYKLRETRNEIITGEAENMPPDGEAYRLVLKNIEQQEQSLYQMFVGNTQEEYTMHEFTVIPSTNDIDKDILFRFSSKLGVLSADDLAGAPVFLSLKATHRTPTVILSPKEEKARDDKFSKGIVYNIPQKATLTISFNSKKIIDNQIDVVQFGTQEVLTNRMFDNNKLPIQVIFYPHLGAIKQIIQ